jgi:hypothetical protein
MNQLSIVYDNKLLECLKKLEFLDTTYPKYSINAFMKELGILYQEYFQYHIASILNNTQLYEPYMVLIVLSRIIMRFKPQQK